MARSTVPALPGGLPGAGPFAPVASGDDAAGRARSRRVELVKQ